MAPKTITQVEHRRREIQNTLDSAITSVQRNRHGQFATPNELAVEIARFVKSKMRGHRGKIRFADPSVGTGSFFSAALQAFGPTRLDKALGVEHDPVFANTARELWTDSGLQVVTGDFTHLVDGTLNAHRANLILANPPYVRHHHIGQDAKQHLNRITQQLTGIKVSGLAGLYIYFFLIATAWMEEDGIAAWLIPSEFMDVNYGNSLKQFLTDRVTLLRVHRFNPDDVQFDDALVSSVIVVFRKTDPPTNHTAEFSFGGTLADPHACDSVSSEVLHQSHKWTLFPKHDRNDQWVSNDADGLTLSDLFTIRRGIATGRNKFFILKRNEAKRLELPGKFLKPILPSPRSLESTIIEADRDGYPRVEPQLCVIDCSLTESVVENNHTELWAYLQTAESLGVRDGYLVTKRTPWYKQEQREPAPFLCTYMGRGTNDKQPFRFILNRSQAIATNLYLMLQPRDAIVKILKATPQADLEVYDLLSRISGYELRGEGRVYGGGLHKIEPRELGRISASPLMERWPNLKKYSQRHRVAPLFAS